MFCLICISVSLLNPSFPDRVSFSCLPGLCPLIHDTVYFTNVKHSGEQLIHFGVSSGVAPLLFSIPHRSYHIKFLNYSLRALYTELYCNCEIKDEFIAHGDKYVDVELVHTGWTKPTETDEGSAFDDKSAMCKLTGGLFNGSVNSPKPGNSVGKHYRTKKTPKSVTDVF